MGHVEPSLAVEVAGRRPACDLDTPDPAAAVAAESGVALRFRRNQAKNAVAKTTPAAKFRSKSLVPPVALRIAASCRVYEACERDILENMSYCRRLGRDNGWTMTMTGAAGQNSGRTASDLLPHLLSVSKTVRQLVGIKLAASNVVVGQDQFLLCFRKGERLTIAAVADRLSVRASTVSKMTDILERQGWVGRETDDRDARKVLVQLTEEGRRTRAAVQRVQAKLEAELAEAFGEDAEIHSVLVKLDAALTQRLRRLR